MSVTIKDVARNCNLSISTVSKVFNGYPDISELTRRQVMEAAREIGYKPNALARALKTNRSFNLGVLFVDDNISGLMHPFFAAVLNAFKAEAETWGYDITFINHNIGTMEMTYLEHCRYRNVDGVCLACVDFYSNEVAELTASTIPCVTIDHLFEGCPSIISDNLNGIHLLVDRAVALGLSNPASIVVIFTLFTFFDIDLGQRDFHVIPILLAVALGSATYWFFFTLLFSKLRKKFNVGVLLWINRLLGAVVMILGVVLLGQGLIRVLFP